MDLGQATVGIVGLGLMGGSLALALQDVAGRIVAVELDDSSRQLALEKGFVDAAAPSPESILQDADLIILAMPVSAILSFIPRLPAYNRKSPIVMDLGSTKTGIAAAFEALPGRLKAVPGHPICGKEVSGLVHADARMYRGAPFVLAPLPNTGETARGAAVQLVESIGAKPLWMEPALHDRLVARTSHLPYVLSLALAGSWSEELAGLVGPGLRGMTRLAGTSPDMGLDMLMSNRENTLTALAAYRTALEEMEILLMSGDNDLLMQKLLEARQVYLSLKSEQKP